MNKGVTMKLITFSTENNPRTGVLSADETRIIDLHTASDGTLPADMLSFLQMGDAAMDAARQLAVDAPTSAAIPFDPALLHAPISNPQKIIAIGRNYAAHAIEQGTKPPDHPVMFAKYPTAIIGPNDTIEWSAALTQQVDAEAELAVIIGKRARNVSAADALNYVAGYTVCNDVSARDLQFSDKQYTRGKSLDTFCPLGPWIVTRDEIPDPQNLLVRGLWNGTVMQEANTGEMSFGVATLIEFISRAFTLLPGDIISTGTPHGVGVFRNPPVFLQNGDTVTIEVEGVGTLTNRCRVIGE